MPIISNRSRCRKFSVGSLGKAIKEIFQEKDVWKPFHPVGDEEPWEHALVHDTQEFGRRSWVIWIILLYSQKELKSYYAFFHEHKETT